MKSAGALLDIPGFDWKTLIIGFHIANYAFETILTARQIRHLSKNSKVPKVLESKIDEKTALKSQDYSLAKLKFSIFGDLYGLVQNVLFMKYDLLPILWGKAGSIMKLCSKFLPAFLSGEITQSLFFFAGFTSISTLLSLPTSYYVTFYLEEKYGFNKSTRKLFFTDLVKTFFLTIGLGTPIVAGFLKIIQYFGDTFMFWVSLFLFCVQIFFIIVYPKFIQPLFNDLKPLEDGELKVAIEKLASDNKFPLDKLYVIDGSKRSAHSNAYFLGLPWGTKQIVIYDTLIKTSSVPEVTAVLGHEIGHWALSHTTKLLIIGQSHLFLIMTLFTAFVKNNSLYESFGFFNAQPILVGFLLFGDILKPLDAAMGFFSNLLSRKYEYEADAYSVRLGYPEELSEALITLHKENLSALNYDWLYSAYHLNHPHITERLRGILQTTASLHKKEK